MTTTLLPLSGLHVRLNLLTELPGFRFKSHTTKRPLACALDELYDLATDPHQLHN
eukprot:COSAG01_NODE_19442_length_1009_cov_1.169231_1_plen_54_part_10